MARIRDRSGNSKNRLKQRELQAAPDDSDQKPPVFSFEYLQPGWCIQDCEQEERSRMLDKIRRLSGLSWRALRQSGRHELGPETIDRKSIKVPVPPFITADVKLLVFRVIGKAPMVGYRSGRIFYVIWIDRTYTLYNHG